MGVTVPSGVITQVPYGLLRGFNFELPPISIVIRDATGSIREWPIRLNQLAAGVPFYQGETLKLIYRAASKSSTAKICELWRVHPSTGAEALDTTITFTAVRQKAVNIVVTAINGSSGALTTTVTYDV